jgi:hypothetical protein
MSNPEMPAALERPSDDPKSGSSRCPRCGARFECGMGGAGPCWCADYPRVMPVPQANAGCYCPACLAELTAQQAAAESTVDT